MRGAGPWAVLGPLIGAVWLLASAAVYLHTTLAGKFRVWSRLLDQLGLRGDEQVLDLGCGRGAVLLAAAQRLPTALPFADGSFDVVLSSLAVHNIRSAKARRQAVDEAVRVLRPGGWLVIADIMHTADYAGRLSELGLARVSLRPLGWRFWYGGPWMATALVTAERTPAG